MSERIIEWWLKGDRSISEFSLDPAENYWLAAYTKKINGVWEVAIVRWQHQSPYLLCLLRDGRKIAGEEMA